MDKQIGDILAQLGIPASWQVKEVLRAQQNGERRRFGDIALGLGCLSDGAHKGYVTTWKRNRSVAIGGKQPGGTSDFSRQRRRHLESGVFLTAAGSVGRGIGKIGDAIQMMPFVAIAHPVSRRPVSGGQLEADANRATP